MEFSNVEKQVLEYFFTSSNENDTVYAAKQTLPQEIIGYIIGRASRAKDTFREIFLNLWKEAGNGIVEIVDTRDSNKNILDKISEKSFKFLNEYKLHNSLRDVPHIAIFCDELSILQTKVWEHEVVAEYQEKSTRYRPFVASNVYIPNNISEGMKSRIENGNNLLIETYNSIFEETGKRDLARYLLPVSSKTAMASMASIRSWERVVCRMLAYPTQESKTLAMAIVESVKRALNTDSFNIDENVVEKYSDSFKFLSDSIINAKNDVVFGVVGQTSLVKKIDGENVYKIEGLIDIGAHRDLQRHRSVIQNFPDYRPIYGCDALIEKYISKELFCQYVDNMDYFYELYFDLYEELKGQDNIGEIQYISLLGHMTKFWYITDRERWQYIYDLRTGSPNQKSTNEKTVHFSYSNWCKETDKKIRELD